MVCFFRVVHSVSDIDNLRSDDTSMLYHRSCYKTYTSRRNCSFFKVESVGSDHKPNTSQVPLLNEQTDDTSTDIALCIFCGKQIFKKDRKLHKIKTAECLQNVKDAAEGQSTGPPSDELDKNIQRTSHGLLLSHWNGHSHFRFALDFSYAFGIL
jgi:hypothetical protein